jgi:hypothetical protein
MDHVKGGFIMRSSIENYENSKKSFIKTSIHVCKICGLKFRNKMSFENHVKEHRLKRRSG